MLRRLIPLLALALSSPALAGDPAKGEAEFRKCRSCHAIITPDGTVLQKGGKTGPNLWGVVGNPVAVSPDYSYGDGILAAKAKGAVWDETAIATYLDDPTAWIRMVTGDDDLKSKMAFRLTTGAEDMAAYLTAQK